MKKITQSYIIYSYDELSEEAKNEALTGALRFFCEAVAYEDMSDKMKKAVDKAEEMQTPWFTHEYMMDYAKDEVEALAREYEYTEDGHIFTA